MQFQTRFRKRDIMSNFEYVPPKNSRKSDTELLQDLKSVANKFGQKKVTQKMYTSDGKYNCSTIIRRFGSWNKALEKAELSVSNIINYTDEELYENIMNTWQAKGSQPVRRDMDSSESKISSGAYSRRFSTWGMALQSFILYANENEMEAPQSSASSFGEKQRIAGRDPSLRLRYRVLKRDNFSCVQCGASPATDISVSLHIDHVVPWSKGGDTTLDNLQTLCEACNLGKSNRP